MSAANAVNAPLNSFAILDGILLLMIIIINLCKRSIEINKASLNS